MTNLDNVITQITGSNPVKLILSNPVAKSFTYNKIVLELEKEAYKITKHTTTQVFHETITTTNLASYLFEAMNNFKQLNSWDKEFEYNIRISKKGKVLVGKSKTTQLPKLTKNTKNHILAEGTPIAPLVDMGIFTKEGKVINAMYDKFKQINRFIEIIDDAIKDKDYRHLTIIDFGCGKSYLTFIVYHYLTQIKKIEVEMIGLDLKEDVITNCNLAAKKYGYENLRFELGDIKHYQYNKQVDIVISLHACDTATDYALYNAIKWNAKMIFSVPCCQHELNQQIRSDDYNIVTRYGVVKERVAALYTDAIRANLLSYMSYKVQLLEFIDFEHTPKNILIRAYLTNIPTHIKQKMLTEVEQLINEYNLSPTLYNLLKEDNR